MPREVTCSAASEASTGFPDDDSEVICPWSVGRWWLEMEAGCAYEAMAGLRRIMGKRLY